MTSANTYMNGITTTSLPTHIKYIHQPLELEQCYLCTHEFNTYLTVSQCSTPSASDTKPVIDNIIYLNDPRDMAKANYD